MSACAIHPEVQAAAYCRECGKPLCTACKIDYLGAIYCADHAADFISGTSTPSAGAAPPRGTATPPPPPPYAPPSPYATGSPYASGSQAHPGLALLLGMIPGVGAIYNGQYAKGLIHALIFGLLITIISHGGPLEPMLGILIAVWWFYMVLEAYHTARKRRDGVLVDEFSSLMNVQPGRRKGPAFAFVMIGAGVVLMLVTSGAFPFEFLVRFWPIGLIVAGGLMLGARRHQAAPAPYAPNPISQQEYQDEPR